MRTDTRARRAIAALAFVALGAAVFAQELGFETRLGNIQFPWSQSSATTDSVFSSTHYFWGGDTWIATSLGEDASLRFSYERDPILRNMAIGTVQFERGIAKISVGPLVGFLNSSSTAFSAGMSAALRLQWPGVAYVSMRSEGGTAISLLQSDTDPQARTEFAVGLYVPHAIVSGVVRASRFNELGPAGNRVTDSLTSYALTFDVFKKNIPYTALFSIGYDLRSKYYAATATSSATTDSLGAIKLGVDASVQVAEGFKVSGGISTGAYVFGLDALSGKGPDSSSFMFDAKLGMVMQLEAVKPLFEHPKKEEAPAEEKKSEIAENAEAKEDEAEAVQAESPKALNLKPSVTSGAGLYYDAYPIPGTGLDFLSLLYNLRGGLWADLMLPIKDDLAVGPELGLYYIVGSSGGVTRSLFDLPVNAKIGYSTGNMRIEGFGGFFSSVAFPANFAFGLDAGARFRYEGFYAEASYVFGLGGAQGFPRFGLGYAIDLVK